MGNVISEKDFKKYTEQFENKMKDARDEEPKSDYTHVVYLWPFAGYSLYPFYVFNDYSKDPAVILAQAVAQAVENGQKNFYYTEEELEDLTDEEKDENYIYLDLSDLGLPNVYIDAYNTKIYTKEEDPYKPEEKKAETEAPVEDSKKLNDDIYYGRIPSNADKVIVSLKEKNAKPNSEAYVILPQKKAHIIITQEELPEFSKGNDVYEYPQEDSGKVVDIAYDIIQKVKSEPVTKVQFEAIENTEEIKPRRVRDSYKVDFYVEGNLLEGHTEDGFETFAEAEEYAEDEIAIISQNGMEKEIPLEDITYEINFVRE